MKIEVLISGPAGEGKSTLARKLKDFLEDEIMAEDEAFCYSTNDPNVFPIRLGLPADVEHEFYIAPEA